MFSRIEFSSDFYLHHFQTLPFYQITSNNSRNFNNRNRWDFFFSVCPLCVLHCSILVLDLNSLICPSKIGGALIYGFSIKTTYNLLESNNVNNDNKCKNETNNVKM